MGPNIRYVPGAYWDFIDHNIALTDRSAIEVMELAGFASHRVVERFLPYTMSETCSAQRRCFSLNSIYACRLCGVFLGKQFLVVVKKSS